MVARQRGEDDNARGGGHLDSKGNMTVRGEDSGARGGWCARRACQLGSGKTQAFGQRGEESVAWKNGARGNDGTLTARGGLRCEGRMVVGHRGEDVEREQSRIVVRACSLVMSHGRHMPF